MSAGEVILGGDYQTKSERETPTTSIQRVFAFVDRQGRKLGATAHRGAEVFRTLSAEKKKHYSVKRIPAGTWFYFSPSSTRNGRHFGACQSRRYFKTEDDRDAAALAYIVQAEKRAGKVRGAVAVAS